MPGLLPGWGRNATRVMWPSPGPACLQRVDISWTVKTKVKQSWKNQVMAGNTKVTKRANYAGWCYFFMSWWAWVFDELDKINESNGLSHPAIKECNENNGIVNRSCPSLCVCVHTHRHTCACSVSKLCLTLHDPMDFPVSSVHVILQNTGVGSHFLLRGNLSDPGIKPTSHAWQTDFLPLRHQGSIHTHTHMFRLRAPQWSSRQKGKVSASLVLESKALGQRTQPHKYPAMSDN